MGYRVAASCSALADDCACFAADVLPGSPNGSDRSPARAAGECLKLSVGHLARGASGEPRRRRAAGGGAFEDRTDIMGLAAGSLASTGLGTGWVDGVERQFEPLAVDRYRLLRRSR